MHTEDVSPRFRDIDLWPPGELVASILAQQLAAVAVVQAATPAITAAAEAAVAALDGGTGRLVQIGAGTSGRLAVQDAAELGPTFGWPAERRLTLIAGGERALTEAVEGAEDEAKAIADALVTHAIGKGDVVVAVAASGRTPFAVAAIEGGRGRGAVTIAIANNAPCPLLAAAEHPIALVTGPEVVAGSTRMAAGTAQRAALTALSTTIMVGLGRTWSNLMVDVAARNAKLDDRRVAIVRQITTAGAEQTKAALTAAGGALKPAVLILGGDTLEAAQARLDRHGGRLRPALDEQRRT